MRAELQPSRPVTRHHDERLDAAGVPLSHWKRLQQVIEQGGEAQLLQRQALVERQIRENGITYNVYADPRGADRLWQLDLLPQLIGAAEWQALAAGVAQRARLLNAVLADLYSEQVLLREGLLPSELVYGHNHYLWACRGIRPPGGIHLHTVAVDLARGPDGIWRVMGDRTQSPSGAGYALENRQIIARTWPSLFRELRVQHLAEAVDTLRDTLAALAPCPPEQTPLSVLLTPGRFNETYFEHVYLARQLGFPLVEGHDLTVRDSRVYLKTLAGLQRVHTILRRLDDAFCDPLELRADSALGIPGLLDAVRQGQVLVANALGSGLLESPGLQGFLPTIAQHLLGEPLQLPSVATWWCGEPPAMAQVLDALPTRVIKPTFPSQRFEPVFGATLSPAEREALAQRLRERPYAYVAQEQVPLSQAPVWRDGKVALQAISLRVFAMATATGDYLVMPGGLTRVAPDAGSIVSMQRGGGSKDTWVLADARPPGDAPRSRTVGARDLVRASASLPSSVAENLFWFGRYTERCDCGTRLLRAALSRLIGDEPSLGLDTALGGAARYGLLPPDRDDPASAVQAALADAAWAGSLTANLHRLHQAGSQVRARLSHENWRVLGEIHSLAGQLAGSGKEDAGLALETLDRLLLSLAALAGFAHDDMTRDDGWRFLIVGRRIERILCLSTLLANNLQHQPLWRADPQQRATLDWWLEIGNSTITYRTRYLSAAQLLPVLDLLLLDDSNPHALLFQLQTLCSSLDVLARHLGHVADPALPALAQQLAAIDLAHLEHSLFGSGDAAVFLTGLARLLHRVAAACTGLSDRLHLRHFAHVADISQRIASS